MMCYSLYRSEVEPYGYIFPWAGGMGLGFVFGGIWHAAHYYALDVTPLPILAMALVSAAPQLPLALSVSIVILPCSFVVC